MKTRQDLIKRTLQKLGILAAGQEPSAEDAALVDQEIVPVLSDLAFRGAYNFGDPDQIEDECFVHLADCIAVSVSADFGQPQDETIRLIAESRLRDLRAEADSGEPVRALYY